MLTLYTIAVILLLFGATIFVHELGHFLVARRCGMVVEVFSIGFGPALWKTKRNGIIYKIGMIPFGGYVALPQMDPSGVKQSDRGEGKRDLLQIAPWKKILVALAGVTGNMIFAIFLAYLVFWFGKPSAPHERNCIVGFVETNSVAYALGLRMGDEISAVDAEPIRNWDDLIQACAIRKSVRLTVKSDGGEKFITVPTEKNWIGVWAVDGIHWVNYCSVISVVPGSSAEQAGIKPGDTILSLDGKKLFSQQHLISLVTEARNRKMPAVIRRGDKEIEVEVQPSYNEEAKRALIGVAFDMMNLDYDQIVHPRPGAQIRDSASMIFRFLRALVTPHEAKAASQALGGPVAIFVTYWWTVQKSFMLTLWFTMVLNVNLAIINLLPIPVVDGGHILFSLWELVTRRPNSSKIVNFIMNAFAGLLIGVFVMLTYRDFERMIVPLFSRGPATVAEPITNAPPAEVQPAK
jgi:regulator of sigma E protease